MRKRRGLVQSIAAIYARAHELCPAEALDWDFNYPFPFLTVWTTVWCEKLCFIFQNTSTDVYRYNIWRLVE